METTVNCNPNEHKFSGLPGYRYDAYEEKVLAQLKKIKDMLSRTKSAYQWNG